MIIEEYNQKFSKSIQELQARALGDIMGRVATQALTLIKDRVIETGKDAEGKDFPKYSTKPMLVGNKSFPKKEVGKKLFGTKEARKKLEWRTLGGGSYERMLSASAGTGSGDLKRLAILQGGYKEWRQLMGAQVNHVDFSVSNQMWNDINVISKKSDHDKGIAIIGAKDESEKKKLAGNTARRGDILDLSQKEIDDLMNTFHLDTLKVFKENGI